MKRPPPLDAIGLAVISFASALVALVTLVIGLRHPERTAMQMLIAHWWFYGLAVLLLIVGLALVRMDKN